MFPKGGSYFPDDTVDTLYAGTRQNMIVTITLHPDFGDKSTVFLTADGADVAELKGVDEDSRTFKLDRVGVLAVRYGTQDTTSDCSYSVSGDYTISLVLR